MAAVLAGLLFVAVSINLGKILPLLGAELLTAGVLAWLVQVGIRLQAVRDRAGPSPAVLIGRIGLAQAAVLPLPGAGVSLLLGAGGGLYWLVPGVRPGPCGRAAGRVGAADRDPAVSATTKQVGTDPAVVSELGLLPGTTMLLVGATSWSGS